MFMNTDTETFFGQGALLSTLCYAGNKEEEEEEEENLNQLPGHP